MNHKLLVDLHRQPGELKPTPSCTKCDETLNPVIPRLHPQVCDACLFDELEPTPPTM